MRCIFWILLQWTWCLPQNLVGLLLLLVHKNGAHRRFRGAYVTAWQHQGCTSMGCFIFMEQRSMDDRPLLVHEYGHTMQSAVLGWLYLPVAGLPSVLWYALPGLRKGRGYYSFYTERWANHWGEKICGEKAVRDNM